LNYNKVAARAYLEKEFGWQYYGGHHLENRMTAFHHSFYTPFKFGLDQRNNTLAAAVRNGSLSRQNALKSYSEPIHTERDLVEYVIKRFDMTEAEFWNVMDLPKRFYTDYPTYKQRFERLRPMFYLLARANLVPMSFYLKYCFPAKVPT